MKYEQGFLGRIFTIRLEHGDKLPDCLENFAKQHKIMRGFCIYLGGIEDQSKVVTGPRDGKVMPPDPMEFTLSGVHEIVGAGTIFPDELGNPKLHSHAAMGREDRTVTGCIRPGITIWKTVEIIFIEIFGECGKRLLDKETGFKLLDPEKRSVPQ